AQPHPILRSVRAGLRRRHGLAAPAVERLVEEERRDAELVRSERAEDLVDADRRERLLRPRILAPHDEMRASVVLSHEGVEQGLSRPRVAHGARERGEDDAARWIVLLDEHLIAAQS